MLFVNHDGNRDSRGSCLAQFKWPAECLGLVRMGSPGILQHIRLSRSGLSHSTFLNKPLTNPGSTCWRLAIREHNRHKCHQRYSVRCVFPGHLRHTTLTFITRNIANLAQSLAMTININDGPTLCRQDADWIVEDFYDAKGQVAFGRFQDVWFEDVGATTTKGQKIDLKNASPISLSNGTAISCVANVFDDNNFWCASQG